MLTALAAGLSRAARRPGTSSYVAFLVVASGFFLLAPNSDLVEFRAREILAYVLVVVGVTVATGLSGQLSLAHAGFAGAGAYAAALLADRAQADLTVILLVVLFGAVAVTAPLGLVVAHLPPSQFALATLSLSLVVGLVAGGLPELTGGLNGMSVPLPEFFGRSLSSQLWMVEAVVAGGVVGLGAWASSGWRGRALRLVRASEPAAQACGVAPVRLRLASFAFAGICAALGGALLSVNNRFVSPDSYGLNFAVAVLSMAVIGGLGSVWGGVAGAIVVVFVGPELIELFGGGGSWAYVVDGGLLILALIVAPRGLAGWLEHHRSSRSTAPAGSPERFLRVRRPTASSAGTIACLDGVQVSFGGVQAVADASLVLQAGQLVGLIGPNGAGKTTLANVLTGVVVPQAGSVEVLGARRRNARGAARAGVGRTFQTPQLVGDLSAVDNVLAGADHLVAPRPSLGEVVGLLQLVGVDPERAQEPVSHLSLATQRLVEVARAAASGPSLLVLDEPLAGLTEAEIVHFGTVLAQLRSPDRCVVIVEHHVDFVLEQCDRVVAMVQGQVVADGDAGTVRTNSLLATSYLGSR